jgi:hypothetical protein
MNRQKQGKFWKKQQASWSFPDATPSRSDLATAELVDMGISLQHVYGTDYAAGYLRFNRIGMDVAVRVLAHPSERRKYREEPA